MPISTRRVSALGASLVCRVERTKWPVSAASTAMFLGHKYSVVTTLDRAVPMIEDRLKLAGLYDRCASVRASGMAVLELETQPERAVETIVEQAAAAAAARADSPDHDAHPVLLLGLPAQHLDQDSRRIGRGQRDRLPRHVGLDGPQRHRVRADGRRRRADRDVGHETEVLDQTTSLAFRCLGGAHHTPMRVV